MLSPINSNFKNMVIKTVRYWWKDYRQASGTEESLETDPLTHGNLIYERDGNSKLPGLE